jgi:hypothetical protein
MKEYESLLQMEEKGDLLLYDLVSSTMAKWMLQKPTPLFQSLVDRRKKQILSQCGTDTITFGIQMRTWRDHAYLHSQLYEAIFDNIIGCTKSWINDALQATTLRSKACVWITSDDPDEADKVAKNLQDIDDRLTFAVAVPPPQDSWHTAESFNSNKTNFDPREGFTQHEELIDWYIFGEADAAIYTVRSTFGRTARMRRGYSGQQKDFLVGRENMNLEFVCNSVQDYEKSSGWSGYGALQFPKKAKS